MKLLIAPLAVMGETGGSASRCRALAAEAMSRGHQVAFCVAEDPNYRPVGGASCYAAPLPSLFGTPAWLGKILARLGPALGVPQRVRVRSFEQALHLMGATDLRFFPRDVAAVRSAIRTFRPDVVYVEARPAAIVAATLEGARVVTSYCVPLRPSFACSPEYAGGVRTFLRRQGLPDVRSVLELFDWAALRFVPSSYDLEPIDDEGVVYVGPFEPGPAPRDGATDPTLLVAYPGVGRVSPRRFLRVLSAAVEGTPYALYLASALLEPADRGPVHVRDHFDFDALLPAAAAYVHHGGQNGVMKALLHGVPQLVVPGDHFERGFNADSVVRLQAGARLDPASFDARTVRGWVERFVRDPTYREHARAAGRRLAGLGGAAKVVQTLEALVGTGRPLLA